MWRDARLCAHRMEDNSNERKICESIPTAHWRFGPVSSPVSPETTHRVGVRPSPRPSRVAVGENKRRGVKSNRTFLYKTYNRMMV